MVPPARKKIFSQDNKLLAQLLTVPVSAAGSRPPPRASQPLIMPSMACGRSAYGRCEQPLVITNSHPYRPVLHSPAGKRWNFSSRAERRRCARLQIPGLITLGEMPHRPEAAPRPAQPAHLRAAPGFVGSHVRGG